MPQTDLSSEDAEFLSQAKLIAARAVQAGDLVRAEQGLRETVLKVGDGVSTLTAELYRALAAVWRRANRVVQAAGLERAALLMDDRVRQGQVMSIQDRRELVESLRGTPAQSERLGAELYALAQAERLANLDLGAARDHLEEAVSIAVELDPEGQETAQRQARLVDLRALSGDDEAALALGDTVRVNIRAADPGVASAMLRTTSQVRFRLGRQDEAKQDAVLALQTAEESGTNHLRAAAHSLMAFLNQQEGNLNSAGVGYREALRLFDSDESAPSVPAAVTRVRLGDLEARLGNPGAAGEMFQQAVDMLRSCAPESREFATASEFLGTHRAEQSELSAALTAFRDAERLFPLGRDKLMLTIRIADILKLKGRYAEAKGELERVLRDAQELNLTEVVDSAMMTLAGVHRWLGELDEAMATYVELHERATVPSDRGAALANLGGIHYERGEYAEAASLYMQARDLLASATPTATATLVLNLGTAKHRLGELDEADRLYQEALATLPASGLTRVEAVTGRAAIANAQGRIDEAIDLFSEGIALTEQLRAVAGADALAKLQRNYPQLQVLLATRGAPGDAERSLELAEMTRARTLDRELRKPAPRLDEGHEVADVRQRLATAARSRMAATADPTTPPYLAADLERRERELRLQLDAYIEAARPTAPAAVLSAAEISLALPQDGVLIEYAVVGQEMHIWAITRETMSFSVLPDDVDAIGELVLRAAGPCHAGTPANGWSAEVWASLGEAVLGPVRHLVEAANTMFVCPDGPLHYVSFEPFVEGPTIVYVPSATVGLGKRAEPVETGALSAEFVGFGNPLFDSELPEFGAYPSLPGAELEVQQIAAMFGDKGRAFLGAAAIEPEVRSWARRCRYLHLATHGFFDVDNPMRSGLVLASPTALQTVGSQFDDVLYAYEMVDLRIGAELVVCASCYTGFGDVRAGEGMESIGAALLMGGARWVLVSLWPVGDLVTATFTLALYRSLIAGISVPRAVDDARREVREYHENPRFWAPFVLFGVQR